MQEVDNMGMTNEQSRRNEILTRIDELNRMEEVTTDPQTLEYIKQRKKELRKDLDTL